MPMTTGMSVLSELTACWRCPRPCVGCRTGKASRARMVRSARRGGRAPVSRARLDPVPAWEELPEAARAAAGCLMAVLMMRMVRAGQAGADRDGHDEQGGAAGPVRTGVASAAGTVRAVGDAAGRHGGSL